MNPSTLHNFLCNFLINYNEGMHISNYDLKYKLIFERNCLKGEKYDRNTNSIKSSKVTQIIV